MPPPAEAVATDADHAAGYRWAFYGVLIALATGGVAGRILAVNSVDNIRLEQRLQKDQPDRQIQRPFLSGNDRSRWLTVRALVERGTYSIDDLVCEPNWDTIDMVQHQDADGRWRLYSSKPPLFPTLIAGLYWPIHQLSGWTLADHPYEIGRGLLLLINATPFAIYLLLMAAVIERLGRSDFARWAVFAAAAFGTLVTTFGVVLNNHLPAIFSVAAALYAAMRIGWDGEKHLRWFILAGLAVGFAVANEMPALSFAALFGLWLLIQSPKGFFLGFLAPAALIAAAFFGTTYLAHGSLRPPYAHRGPGEVLFVVESLPSETLDAGEQPVGLLEAFQEQNQALNPDYRVFPREPGAAWTIDGVQEGEGERYYIQRTEEGFAVHAWDDWYDYRWTCGRRERESYWRNRERQAPIDQGVDDPAEYALHVLVGHHGVFSLTPFWLLWPVGCLMLLARGGDRRGWWAALGGATLLLSAVVIGFYLARPVTDRNYGGTSSGMRWLLWLTPLWLLACLPAAEWLGKSTVGRWLCYLLLGASTISVTYPVWNPWTHPWLAIFFEYLGWLEL